MRFVESWLNPAMTICTRPNKPTNIPTTFSNPKNIVSKLLIGVSISATPVLAKQGIASSVALAIAKYAYRAYFPTRFKLNFLM